MKFLSYILSALLFVQSSTLWAQDNKASIIEQELKNLSYEIDTQKLTQDEVRFKVQEITEKFSQQGIKSNDMINYVTSKLNDKKTAHEFKRTVKMIQKQKLSEQEVYKRLAPYMQQLEIQGASFKKKKKQPEDNYAWGAYAFLASIGLIVIVAVIAPYLDNNKKK